MIGEVKSRGEQRRFNEALRSSHEAVESVLHWCGYFTAAERPALADAVLKILELQTGGQNAPTATGPRASRVRAVLFSRKGARGDTIRLGSLRVRRSLPIFGAACGRRNLARNVQRPTTVEPGVAGGLADQVPLSKVACDRHRGSRDVSICSHPQAILVTHHRDRPFLAPAAVRHEVVLRTERFLLVCSVNPA